MLGNTIFNNIISQMPPGTIITTSNGLLHPQQIQLDNSSNSHNSHIQNHSANNHNGPGFITLTQLPAGFSLGNANSGSQPTALIFTGNMGIMQQLIPTNGSGIALNSTPILTSQNTAPQFTIKSQPVVASIDSTIDNVVQTFSDSRQNLNSNRLTNIMCGDSSNNQQSQETRLAFACSLCEKTYRYRHGLTQHMQLAHLGRRPFTCATCSKTFLRRNQLDRHTNSGHCIAKLEEINSTTFYTNTPKIMIMKTDMDDEDRKPSNIDIVDDSKQMDMMDSLEDGTLHNCRYCEQSFVSSEDLLLHTRSHSQSVYSALYVCEICGMQLQSKSSLTKHKRREHSQELHTKVPDSIDLDTTRSAPHGCSICKKRFMNRYGLRRHIRTHTGERPHNCDICGLSFMERSHMKQHRMTHTGETPYSCDLCDRGFSRKFSYQRHLRWHAKSTMAPAAVQVDQLAPETAAALVQATSLSSSKLPNPPAHKKRRKCKLEPSSTSSIGSVLENVVGDTNTIQTQGQPQQQVIILQSAPSQQQSVLLFTGPNSNGTEFTILPYQQMLPCNDNNDCTLTRNL